MKLPATALTVLCMALGCSLLNDVDELAGESSASDAGGGSGGGGAGGTGAACTTPKTGEKVCGATCVPIEDPGYGCAPTSCAPCDLPHASAGCESGACRINACQGGFVDCDKLALSGCEADVNSDPTNCGQCGSTCSNGAGNFVCVMGSCQPSSCSTGRGECDGNPAGSCETDLLVNPNNCGYCGHVCELPHATAACVAGECTIAGCETGFSDCDQNPATGCEVDTSSDVNRCGSCTRACVGMNGAPRCEAGSCKIDCNAGFGDCDLSFATGCEVDLTNNAARCGSCDNTCTGSMTCVQGSCR